MRRAPWPAGVEPKSLFDALRNHQIPLMRYAAKRVTRKLWRPCLRQTEKRVIHQGIQRTTKGHQGVEVNRDRVPRSRRDYRFRIVLFSYDPHGRAGGRLVGNTLVSPGRSCPLYGAGTRPNTFATHGYLLSPPTRLNSQRARGPWADAHG